MFGFNFKAVKIDSRRKELIWYDWFYNWFCIYKM